MCWNVPGLTKIQMPQGSDRISLHCDNPQTPPHHVIMGVAPYWPAVMVCPWLLPTPFQTRSSHYKEYLPPSVHETSSPCPGGPWGSRVPQVMETVGITWLSCTADLAWPTA